MPKSLYEAVFGGTRYNVKPGEFRVCRLEDVIPRFVLVVATTRFDCAVVLLCTNEIEYRTDADVWITPAESGLPFDLLVETDMVGSVHMGQLDVAQGFVSSEIRSNLFPKLKPDKFEHTRLGFPIDPVHDSRIAWKYSEFENFWAFLRGRADYFLD